MFKQVKEFHEAFGHPRPATPQFITAERLAIRRKWADEERVEFDEAFARGDLVGCADAIADELYFLLGTAVEMGLPMDGVVTAVHEIGNMSKLNHQEPHLDNCDMMNGPIGARCTCGKIEYNELGKVKKPPGWRGPEAAIQLLLLKAGWDPFDDKAAEGNQG